MTRRQATPRIFAGKRVGLPALDVAPADREHPRIGEYVRYANPIRFPKTFAEWLSMTEAREAGKSLEGHNLQRAMDNEKYCLSPAKIRVNR